jgi:hypothetical protein
MRTGSGEELRSQYDLTKPLFNDLNELLKELDEERDVPAAASGRLRAFAQK